MAQDFDRDNPKYWKWGIFYVNADDSRMVVPKRNPGLGWTFNFAHPKVWLALAAIAAILVSAKVLIK